MLEELLEQVAVRDERIRVLSEELERRTRRVDDVERRLEIESRIAGAPIADTTFVQVFWPEKGVPTEARSIRRHIRWDASSQSLSFDLPAVTEDVLRIDVGETPGYWEIEELQLLGVTEEGALASPLLELREEGLASLSVIRGLVKLSVGKSLRLYSLDCDPQLQVLIPKEGRPGKGNLVLNLKVKALGGLHGFRASEHELLTETVNAVVKATCEVEVASLRSSINTLASELSARQQLEGQLSKLFALNEVESSAGSFLREELKKREESNKIVAADLAAARAQLEQSSRTQLELSTVKLELERLTKQLLVREQERDQARREADAARRNVEATQAAIASTRQQVVAPVASHEVERLRGEVERLRLERDRQQTEILRLSGGVASPRSLRQRVAATSLGKKLNRFRLLKIGGGWIKPTQAADCHPSVLQLFNGEYYLRRNPDVAAAGVDPLKHFLERGWREGRDPSPLFNMAYYLRHCPDAVTRQINPLVHYVERGAAEGYSPHALFDVKFYLQQISPQANVANPLLHYLLDGFKQGLDPHPLFSSSYYRHHCTAARQLSVSPLEHYVTEGWRAGYSPYPLFDLAYYQSSYPDVVMAGYEPLAHFVECGNTGPRNPTFLFDTRYYLHENPSVGAAGINALIHYVRFGWKEGRNPHPAFDVAYYLRANPDVARHALEPLSHFISHGNTDLRDPSPMFDMAFYALANPGLVESGVNLLAHFLATRPAGLVNFVSPRQVEAGPLRLVVLLDEWSEAFQVRLEIASSFLRVLRRDQYRPEPGDYVYAPCSEGSCVSPSQLVSALICLAFCKYDFLIFSGDIREPEQIEPSGAITATSSADALVLSGECWTRRKAGLSLEPGAIGRVIRVFHPSAEAVKTVPLSGLGLGNLAVRAGGGAAVLGPGVAARRHALRREPPQHLFHRLSGDKPLVLVFPSMLAVGGVERNTIEVMRIAASKYDFVVVTNERHRAEMGSLHHQAIAHAKLVVDLAELADQSLYLPMLRSLSSALRPDLIWICNGSIWLSENAEEFRETFADVPIVDQQVYDTSAGWIAEFDRRRGLKRFDRYIAINSRIQEKLVNAHGIPANRVDLIHPMMDGRRFQLRELSAEQVQAERGKWGLPSGDVPIFAQVGRLTSQKQPIDFLDMVRRVKAEGIAAYFVLVGAGELAKDCDAYIAQHDLGDIVRRIEFIEDPSTLYPLLSGLVVCSAYEGLPIVVLENLAMGVPVLSTNVGDVKLVVEGYGSGLISDGSGGEAMFEAFRSFYGNLDGYRQAARQNADAVNHRFSEKTIGAQYDGCFESARLQRGFDIRVGSSRGISVVMPTYNRVDQLRKTLSACIRYSGGIPIEFVVVNDGSRDGTREFLEQLGTQVPNLIHRTVTNGGPGQARNLGASLARNEVIMFVGDDAEPIDPLFFSTHLDLHVRDTSTSLAVLGKMIWPDHPQDDVSFVMQHIQGVGGEQFGYADLRPYQVLDWRFFYTANISVKKSVVENWLTDGFSKAFRFAAWEDAELAYRLSKRPDPLRILYAPSSVAYHQHHYSVDQFLNRQQTAGMMARVMIDLHPELAERVIPAEVLQAMSMPVRHEHNLPLADHLAVIEGIKAYARLLERHHKIGSVHWHKALLYGVFEVAYYQGFLAASSSLDSNFALAYRRVLEMFYRRVQHAFQIEFLGYSPKADKVIPGL